MSQAKHTAGPWSVNTLPDYHTEIFSGNLLICEVIGGQSHLGQERNIAQDEANAKLIAASPDLLAVLKQIYDSSCASETSTPSKAAFLNARLIIAKAEGVS